MRGDFSRDTYDPLKRFSRVLRQQGRVDLDADWNEQADIFLELVRKLAADLIGPYGGPAGSFAIEPVVSGGELTDLSIGRGHYYVDGILCENETPEYPCGPHLVDAPMSYLDQPDYFLLGQPERAFPPLPFQVYLDVWERGVTAADDDDIREVALGGPDTAVRSKVVWQVRVRAGDPDRPCSVRDLAPLGGGCLKARADSGGDNTDPCLCPPDARYRGLENQLYRVEIHRGGQAWNGVDPPDSSSNAKTAATFKWSRDNGSVVFPIVKFEGSVLTLEYLGRDARTDLTEGDLVEVEYLGVVLGPRDPLADPSQAFAPPPLLTVKSIDRSTFTVTLDGDLSRVSDGLRATATLLRRWDRPTGMPALGGQGMAADGSALIQEEEWIDLEDGVQVYFEPLQESRLYRSGDYWLVPARTATGDVIWPKTADGQPEAQAPRGIVHRYAPLAWVTAADTKRGAEDCRCRMTPLARCPPEKRGKQPPPPPPRPSPTPAPPSPQ